MSATVLSAVLTGTEAIEVKVEVDLLKRLPCVCIVGLPAGIVRETAERVRSAIISSGFDFPKARVVVNVSPADLPKANPTGMDLPIAVAILAASGQLSPKALESLNHTILVGELALSGNTRPVRGSVPVALLAEKGCRSLILGGSGTLPASLFPSVTCYAASSLLEALAALGWEKEPVEPLILTRRPEDIDFSDVRGQSAAITALEEAVKDPGKSGDYILLVGKPGCGKTMLARRLTTILPVLTMAEAREVAAVQSAAGLLDDALSSLPSRPFQAPHSSITATGMLGISATSRPGEVSLAHHGVLYLDDVEEFTGAVLRMLASVLRDGTVRVGTHPTLPARPALVVAAVSDESQIKRVTALLGPPRAMIHVELVAREALAGALQGESSAIIRARVEAAWASREGEV